MRRYNRLPFIWLLPAASMVVLLPALSANAQAPQTSGNTPDTAAGSSGAASDSTPDRSGAYFHDALANMYEEQAIEKGSAEFVQHAIEEYKAAINADPHSPQLYDGLAELYFRTGRAHEA